MIIRQIEAHDLTEIAKWEREISKISFGEEAITDLAFHLRKLEKAMIRERSGMMVLDIDGCAAGWMWMSFRVNSVTQDAYLQFRSFSTSMNPFAVQNIADTAAQGVIMIKCLIWDLDDTLWKGTLSEDEHVVLRPGVQEVMLTLDQRGILQSIASRNDPDRALQKLVALGIDHFFLYPQFGWGPKQPAFEISLRR